MTDFAIETLHPKPKTVVLKLLGEFKGQDVYDFEPEFIHHLKGHNADHVVLDFSNVPYIDSSAIGLLMKCRQTAQEVEKKVSILKPSDRVAKILKSTHISDQLHIIQELS